MLSTWHFLQAQPLGATCRRLAAAAATAAVAAAVDARAADAAVGARVLLLLAGTATQSYDVPGDSSDSQTITSSSSYATSDFDSAELAANAAPWLNPASNTQSHFVLYEEHDSKEVTSDWLGHSVMTDTAMSGQVRMTYDDLSNDVPVI